MSYIPTDAEITDYARFAAKVVCDLRDSDPDRAARIAAKAERQVARMYEAQRAAQ